MISNNLTQNFNFCRFRLFRTKNVEVFSLLLFNLPNLQLDVAFGVNVSCV